MQKDGRRFTDWNLSEDFVKNGGNYMLQSKPTQNERILDYIAEFGSITQIDALKDLGVMRLASRVSDLRKMGYPIESKVEAVKNRYGENCYIKRYTLYGDADEG